MLSAAVEFTLIVCAEVLAFLPAPHFGWDAALQTHSNLCILSSFTFLFYIVITFFVRDILQLIDNRLNFRLGLQLTIAAFCIALTALWQLLHTMLAILPVYLTRYSVQLHFLSALLCLFALHSIISLVHTLNTSIRETEAAKLRETSMQYELKHYQALAAKDSSYLQLRHDFKNHLLSIQALANAGEYDRLQEYACQLSDSLARHEPHIQCGHLLIDSMLNAKAQQMKDNCIALECRLDPMPITLRIRDIDLCALFGNLLDNAIEACLLIDPPELRRICISLRHANGALVLQIVNSAQRPDHPIQDMWTMSRKQKERKGLGLPACRQIVGQYGGSFDIHMSEAKDAVVNSVILPDAA